VLHASSSLGPHHSLCRTGRNSCRRADAATRGGARASHRDGHTGARGSDGEARVHAWRVGPAAGSDRSGPYKVTQTERIGPMLGGDVMVIEGRGYRDDNTTGFNAFAAISWNAQTEKYEIRSYAQGYAGTFDLTPTADGYVWSVPAGPNAMIRFTATVKNNTWREVGEYVAEGGAPKQTFEMNLKRIGDTDWPLGTPVSPQLGR